MFHVIAFAKCPSNELSVTCLYLFIKPVCAACFKAKHALAARDPVFSASQSGSVHSEICFWMCCEFSAHLRPQRAPVTLCFHISIIFNILMGKCWPYFARFEMRRVCKPFFTEAGFLSQNKSSTTVSAKIKVHRFISCKQGLKLTDANKENIVQVEQAHCLLDEKYKIVFFFTILIK